MRQYVHYGLDLLEAGLSWMEPAVSWIPPSFSWLLVQGGNLVNQTGNLINNNDDSLEWLSGWPGYLLTFFSGVLTVLGIQKLRRWREGAAPQEPNQDLHLPGPDHSEQLNRVEQSQGQILDILSKLFVDGEPGQVQNPRDMLDTVQLQSRAVLTLAEGCSSTVTKIFAVLNEESNRRVQDTPSVANSSTPSLSS